MPVWGNHSKVHRPNCRARTGAQRSRQIRDIPDMPEPSNVADVRHRFSQSEGQIHPSISPEDRTPLVLAAEVWI